MPGSSTKSADNKRALRVGRRKKTGGESAKATLETLYKIFTVPESPDSTLAQLDQEISKNLAGFLQTRIVALEKDLTELEQDFSDSTIPEQPRYVSDHTEFLLEKLVAHSVHTAAPSFIGHMTSALPYFMLPLSKIMLALNQNLVKIETSRASTPMERQVIGMMHRLVFGYDHAFYQHWMHQRARFLGTLCSGGTIANITALWLARNNAFPAQGRFAGIQQDGWIAALRHYGYQDAAVLVSELGHYSLNKAADLLGLGRKQIIAIPVDQNFKVDVRAMTRTCERLAEEGVRIIAIVGIAGATETGTIDPLAELADLAQRFHCHYHVDAAWGGPTLFSSQHAALLQGIERADSVTIDAHKQMYTPVGAGMVLFRDPSATSAIEQQAEYVVRRGSKDLGIGTLEGSRPGMALLVHAGLHIIGRRGYELLIDQGIAKAKYFAALIQADADFELISVPELNILTYRYTGGLHQAQAESRQATNSQLNELTILIQKTQRQRGKSFVSRTRLRPERYARQPIVVFRVVLANPLTTETNLHEILEEQRNIASEPAAQAMLKSLG